MKRGGGGGGGIAGSHMFGHLLSLGVGFPLDSSVAFPSISWVCEVQDG